jgi:uncharacterized coiled-coil protein SlyX
MFGQTGTRLQRLEDKLAELERELHELRDLPVEWEDWLHKIRNVLARLNRRAEREEEAQPTTNGRKINPAAARILGISQGGNE